MTVAQDAIDRGAKAPLDRLGKAARKVTVGIYGDEQLAEDWERAVADLDTAKRRHLDEFPRRSGLAAAAARDRGEPEADASRALQAEMDAELDPLRDRVADSLAALDEQTLWLTFRSLGRRRWREMVAEHPPTATDQEDWEKQGQTGKPPYCLESLARALVQESAVSPVLSRADVDAIFDGDAWNDMEVSAVFTTALAAQTAARQVTHRRPPRR